MAKQAKTKYAKDRKKQPVAIVAGGMSVPTITRTSPMQRIKDIFTTYAKPQTDGCVLWTGPKTKGGYGILMVGGRYVSAHAIAWFICYGQRPPPGLDLDHLCKDMGCTDPRHWHACVNVQHLEAVTHAVNMQRIKTRKLAGQVI